ncbi:MAG: hypothetical protein PHP75_01830 [Methylacidiphilaceae bacterium]|nr:hypothetical protein [Candidatus Methylacidiphilaceae bacterium]
MVHPVMTSLINQIAKTPVGNVPPAMRTTLAHYDRIGLRANPLVLRSILGRAPRSRAAYFQALASKGISSTTA